MAGNSLPQYAAESKFYLRPNEKNELNPALDFLEPQEFASQSVQTGSTAKYERPCRGLYLIPVPLQIGLELANVERAHIVAFISKTSRQLSVTKGEHFAARYWFPLEICLHI